VLRDPSRRTPAAVLLAARAAAGWGGWTEVDRLLRRESWVATRYTGSGYELLARSALERGVDTSALKYATASVRRAPNARSRAVRTVLLARALDRLNQKDSAQVTYEKASGQLRDARDWLLLRAAGVTADSTERQRLFSLVRSPVARERIPWTDAQARERTGDTEGAADKYARLGAMPSAFRLRLGLPSDSAGRQRLREEVVAYIRAKRGTPDARVAVEVLDAAFPPPSLTASEELIVARSASASGPVARAIAGYQRGIRAPEATSADRLDYGQALIRAGRYRDAINQLEQVDSPRGLAALAGYQRARALLNSGARSDAKSALRDVAERFGTDTAGASSALYLLGDLSTDDGRDDESRSIFRDLYTRYPTSARADDARFKSAIIAFTQGDERRAALEFDSLVAVNPLSPEALAARYWSGRSWLAAGDSSLARVRWRDVVSREPLSYYASASGRRLGLEPWSPAGGVPDEDRFPRVAAVDSVIRRIDLLEQLGMDVEAKFEYDALEQAATSSTTRLLATASALRSRDQTSRAIRLAWKAVERGERNARVYRLAYPLVDREELTRQASARALDPAIVAGIIRQESSFNPRAVSVAGARGLMQVLPSVGQQVARSLRFPVWDSVLLFDADANLELGTTHLASFMKQYDGLVRVLAAYNAGGSRVDRWSGKGGVEDPEVFTERIPFTETRDYVRIVQRNVEVYRVLWRLGNTER
jgi:soluble lytic murein transglycosylase